MRQVPHLLPRCLCPLLRVTCVRHQRHSLCARQRALPQCVRHGRDEEDLPPEPRVQHHQATNLRGRR